MSTLVIAKATFGEAWRKKILNIFLLAAIGLIAFSVSFAFFSPGEQMVLIKSMGLGVIAIGGTFIAIIMGITLIPAEIEKRTIYTILSKPVKRHEFLLGKFLGGVFTLLVNITLMSVVFMAMVAWKAEWHVDWALLKGILMIFFQVLMLIAVSVFCSVFATPVVNFFLSSAAYIIGSLSAVTMSLSRLPEKHPIVRGFWWLLHYLVPNFANFFTQNPLIHPEVVIKNELIYYAENILYALIYTSALLIGAILLFERREV